MIIFEDTRNKPEKNAHIKKQLEDLGHEVKRTKLYVGDYTLPTNQTVCIDTKQDLQEVAGNLTQSHERFRDECIRAQEAGIKLIVLITEPTITKLSDVCLWYNWRRKTNKKAINGRTLFKIMSTFSNRYNVEWQFCKKENCGRKIIELLGGSYESDRSVESHSRNL